jgi:tRNA (mo5U34)-methyltransferase
VSLIDDTRLRATLADAGLERWQERITAMVRQRLSDEAHGDFPRWRTALDALAATGDDAPAQRRELLLALAPWRKGPFEVGGILIDSEWRSDRKWARVAPAIESLAGRRVLDVGCGNGYYSLQMAMAGARRVVGLEPMPLYVMQFLAINHFAQAPRVDVLPLRLDEFPADTRAFDTTFSMGVLYHQRSPLDHLLQLRQTLRPGGQLVLETLFLPGDEAAASTPPGRYARMRNVWLLPTLAELSTWLRRSGFVGIEVADESVTTLEEQRRTEWMPFESLAEALDPANSSLTVEGWPAPRRVVVLARAP